ncbi:TfoX/Sxy family protein [Candidatus Kaiserbacteria bacterium]|nr:TfoX/Sxy family protein [Candidatus Kaiserbacteria bacterium]
MAYDQELADRVKAALSKKGRVVSKPMMGGITFMLKGKMCVGVHEDRIMCRIDPLVQDEALKHKGSKIMVMGGKTANGFIFVKKDAVKDPKEFKYWIGLAVDFNKRAKASKRAKR